MSDDDSDYYSDSSEDSNEESVKVLTKKSNIPLNAAKKFGNYIEDESDLDDSEPDNEDENEEEDDNIQFGGVEDDPEQDYSSSESVDADDDADIDDNEDEVNTVIDEEPDDSDIEIGEDGEVVEKKPRAKITKPKKTTQLVIEDDEDDEDEYEENYLQKFDSEVNKNYIYEFHPECLNHNSDEVEKLAKVTRDENNIIIDPLHRTLPYLTKYEKARILGQRAKQIEVGAKPLVKVPENIIDGYIIAELELREKKIPFIIKRPIPGGAFEYWHIRDLENINF